MRILLSAYACEPGRGSEPEVGLQVALAAASQHEVWVITRENNLRPLKEYFREHPLRERIHLVGLDVEGIARSLKKRGGLITLHWYYDRWQRRLADLAMNLDEEFDFDIVHHATFASYWNRVGLASVNKPLIWGPIGGGVKPPLRLLPVMGFKGAVGDVVRMVSRAVVARVSGSRRVAKRAHVILAQNPETASVIRDPRRTRVLPHALLAAQSLEEYRYDEPRSELTDTSTHVIMAARLVGWKGPALALLAVRHLRDPSTIMSIYGDGPHSARLKTMCAELGLEHQVRFVGNVPRTELLNAISGASVLIHPSLHDDSPLVVAEALALGIPVVGLDRGGPPVIASFWPQVPSRFVAPSSSGRTAMRLARAVDELSGRRVSPNTEPARRFRSELMTIYAQAGLAAPPK